MLTSATADDTRDVNNNQLDDDSSSTDDDLRIVEIHALRYTWRLRGAHGAELRCCVKNDLTGECYREWVNANIVFALVPAMFIEFIAAMRRVHGSRPTAQ